MHGGRQSAHLRESVDKLYDTVCDCQRLVWLISDANFWIFVLSTTGKSTCGLTHILFDATEASNTSGTLMVAIRSEDVVLFPGLRRCC